MKTKILSSILLLISISAFAQLRVDQFGRIGMGTNYPNPNYKLHIKGDLLLTTYPEIPAPNTYPVEFRLKVGNGWPGAEMGTNVDIIAFWTLETGYNKLYAEGFYVGFEKDSKTNIVNIENSLEIINKLNSCSFYINNEKLHKKQIRYGFLAEEVAQAIPEITDTARGVILIDYNQITPLLVSATKELNKTIDSLKQELFEIKNEITDYCNQKNPNNAMGSDIYTETQHLTTNISNNTPLGNSKLFQNRPNPFTEETKIEFNIKTKYSSASILVFDMQGTLKKTIPISENGKGYITVNGYELTAGMYLYSLIIDGKEFDTKRMILLD